MNILVTGVGRSGTTWVGAALGRTAGAAYLHEPDNGDQSRFALRAMAGLGDHPVLGPDDRAPAALVRLWDVAFGAPPRYVRGQQRAALALSRGASFVEQRAIGYPGRSAVTLRLRAASRLAVPTFLPAGTRHRIVKSVRVQFALDWISARWNPIVVVCRRHPLHIVASLLELGHDHRIECLSPGARAFAVARFGAAEPETDDPLVCHTWRTGLLSAALDGALRVHPEFHAIDHEDFCREPVEQFHALADALGLEWTSECEAFVQESNRPGSGYELNRVAAEEPEKWRRRLTADEAKIAVRVLAQFPMAERYDDLTP